MPNSNCIDMKRVERICRAVCDDLGENPEDMEIFNGHNYLESCTPLWKRKYQELVVFQIAFGNAIDLENQARINDSSTGWIMDNRYYTLPDIKVDLETAVETFLASLPSSGTCDKFVKDMLFDFLDSNILESLLANTMMQVRVKEITTTTLALGPNYRVEDIQHHEFDAMIKDRNILEQELRAKGHLHRLSARALDILANHIKQRASYFGLPSNAGQWVPGDYQPTGY